MLRSFTSVSEKLSEVFSSFNLDAKVGTGSSVPFFSGSISASYGNSKQVKSQTKFYKYVYSSLLRKHTLNPMYLASAKTRDPLFDPLIFEIINDNDNSAQTVFELLGTHIITSCGTGGSASITALYNSNESAEDTDIKAALDFSLALVSGSVNASLSDKQKSVREETEIKVKSSGGTATIVGTTPEAIAPQLKEWAGTIKDGPTLGYIYTVIPIWELASNTARSNELKAAFLSRAEDINQTLLSYFSKAAVPQEPAIVDGAVYIIQNWYSRLAIDVEGPSKESGAAVHLWEKHGRDSQQWQAVESWVYPGYFSFRNIYSGKFLDVQGGNTNNHLWQYLQNGTDSQLFSIEENADGSIYIRSRLHGDIGTLDVNHENGIKLYIRDSSADGRLKWKLERVR